MAVRQQDAERVHQVAQAKFGYEKLRPGQQEAIISLLQGQDTLAIMPTGAGKSAIYQIAALLLPNPTIVVSPLIALQNDQVQSIQQHDIAAAVLNSALSSTQRQATLEAFAAGELKFLLLAPEQFNNEETLTHLSAAQPSLVVVDEAHCISEWGHDFRPDYLKLGAVLETLGHPVTLALTATASPPVRAEIVQRLSLREPYMIVQGFNRPNIHLSVERFESEGAKRDVLIERVVAAVKADYAPGIVYTATRQGAEEISQALNEYGVRAAYYHAGMKKAERDVVQEQFMADELEVIVATIAFGMGVDKPNVRFVFHLDISDSPDAYYQEIGRAGRDSEPARAILFYDPQNLNLRRFFAASGQIDIEQVEQVANVLQEHDGPVEPQEIADITELSQGKITTAIHRLEEVGALETAPNGEAIATVSELDVNEAAAAAAQAQERHQMFQRSRVTMMQEYAEGRGCRRTYLLNYFGEEFQAPCNYCDNCDMGVALQLEAATGEQPFPVNSQVAHKEWGEGQVLRYEADKIVVLFDSVGYKTLAVALVCENNLLTACS